MKNKIKLLLLLFCSLILVIGIDSYSLADFNLGDTNNQINLSNDIVGNSHRIISIGSMSIATTTDAGYKLNIVGDANIKGTLYADNINSGSMTISAPNVSAGQFGANTGGGNYSFPADLNVDSGTLYVDSTNGRVGIGEISPQTKLEIKTVSSDDILRLTHSGATSTIFKIGSDAAMVINNNGLDILTLKDSKIGIGTTTPSETLDIEGNISIGGNSIIKGSAGVERGYVFKNTGGTVQGAFGAIYDPSGYVNELFIGDGLNSNKWLRVSRSSGNVGIGGSAAVSGLSIYRSGNAWLQLETGGSSDYADFRLKGPNYYWDIWMDNDDGKLRFYNGSTRMLIQSDGKVGIATTSPSYTLHVNGSFAATSKNFDITDPRYNNFHIRLVHSTLEGPEHGVYYRGEARLKNGITTVKLPSYFEALTRKENRTVLLTCKNGWSPLYVRGSIENGRFVVATTGEGDQSQEFYWEVKAERSDVPTLIPEQKR